MNVFDQEYYPVSVVICLHDLYSCCICLFISNRHILACLHFNENVRRDTMKTKDGKKYMKVTYPKHKLGDEVVREVRVPPTYRKYVTLNCKHA